MERPFQAVHTHYSNIPAPARKMFTIYSTSKRYAVDYP